MIGIATDFFISTVNIDDVEAFAARKTVEAG
jgi:hypothetical protein